METKEKREIMLLLLGSILKALIIQFEKRLKEVNISMPNAEIELEKLGILKKVIKTLDGTYDWIKALPDDELADYLVPTKKDKETHYWQTNLKNW